MYKGREAELRICSITVPCTKYEQVTAANSLKSEYEASLTADITPST